MKSYIQLMRVKQWVKNLFVFIPAFFSGKFIESEILIQSILGFFMFSLIASSIYIINDYVDIEADKKHPEKKDRPLATGVIKKTSALVLLGFLLVSVILLLIIVGNLHVASILGLYFLMNLAYSFGLKHVAIVDVLIISIGFLLRVFVGGFITNIFVSDWAILLTFTLALILALGKRRGELVNKELEGKTRKALDGYNLDFLNVALTIASTITIVCYVMYVLSPEVQNRVHRFVFFTFVFVFAGILRYLQQTFVYNTTESPTQMIFKDLFLQITLLLWGICFFLLIYLK